MHITAVDNSAVMGRSALHSASPRSKVIAFTLVLASVVLTNDILMLAAVLLLLAAITVASRLPLREIAPLAAYPAVFAAVFAFASAPSALSAVLIIGKAVTAALVALVLMFTTPYPQVFGILQRALPQIVGDALLMTYRSLFLLADKFTNLIRAVRLRSGLVKGHPLRAAKVSATALGGLLLYALDLSQREYDILVLRGYERRLRVTLPAAESPAFDATLLAVATALPATAATLRRAPDALGGYSWMVASASLLVFAISVLVAGRRS